MDVPEAAAVMSRVVGTSVSVAAVVLDPSAVVVPERIAFSAIATVLIPSEVAAP